MNREDIERRVREYLASAIRTDDLDDGDDLFATGVVTSLFAMQLVLFVESEFHVPIENEDLDMENFRSIRSISAFVTMKSGVQSSQAASPGSP